MTHQYKKLPVTFKMWMQFNVTPRTSFCSNSNHPLSLLSAICCLRSITVSFVHHWSFTLVDMMMRFHLDLNIKKLLPFTDICYRSRHKVSAGKLSMGELLVRGLSAPRNTSKHISKITREPEIIKKSGEGVTSSRGRHPDLEGLKGGK